jgi:hypothetical protein
VSRKTTRRIAGVIGLGLVVLIIGFSLAWLGGYGYLPLNPHFMVVATILLFLVTLLFSGTTMMTGTSFIARENISTIPVDRRDGFLSRLVRDQVSRKEIIIDGHENTSIREILKDSWPFDQKMDSEWYITDEKGNDVTNWPISNWDGIAHIHFKE